MMLSKRTCPLYRHCQAYKKRAAPIASSAPAVYDPAGIRISAPRGSTKCSVAPKGFLYPAFCKHIRRVYSADMYGFCHPRGLMLKKQCE